MSTIFSREGICAECKAPFGTTTYYRAGKVVMTKKTGHLTNCSKAGGK